MAIKCGIVGLPNVGKSTLFNALTAAGIDAANYPFCTIDPNVGVVTVPDKRLQKISDIVQPQQTIATTMEFFDIAGLVAGAAKGEGLGNKFLAHIRETQAIAHVVRCFEDPDVIHVAGKVNPLDDIAIINTELALADLETVEKALTKRIKLARSGDKDARKEVTILEKIKSHLDQGLKVQTLNLDEDELTITQPLHLLTQKPTLYIANVDENGWHDNPYITKVKEYAAQENAQVVPLCAAIEAELSQLETDEQAEFLRALGIEEPGLHSVIRASYDLLHLQTFFTAGPKEVRAWAVHKGAKAPQAAAVIHTDFEKGFIRAEVISYADFIQYKGEHGAREAGRLRLEGKEYLVKDGDIMHFRFNV